MIDALFDLLGSFYQNGDFVQAEWIARSILQAIPDDIVSLQFLGLLYYRTRRREQALKVFAAAGDAPAGVSGAAPLDDGLQASAQCLRAARSRGSTLAGAWYDLGRLLLRLGHDQQALNALQAAIAARPDFAKARRAVSRLARPPGRTAAPRE